MIGPVLFIDAIAVAIPKNTPIAAFAIAWGVLFAGGMVLAIMPFYAWLKEQGRVAFTGRPNLGLAQKPWGPLAASIVFPALAAIAPVGLALGYFAGISTVGIALIALMGVITAVAYLRMRAERTRKHQALLSRPLATGDVAPMPGEALDFVARVCGIPGIQLYATDRFGKEIGTLHIYDETLDRLGGMMLKLQRDAGRRMTLQPLVTLRDYIEEWERCRQINK